jgi:hypothetical protein
MRCMAKAPHRFEDLKLRDVGEVEGIKSGLDIKGMGTFKFKINDNNSMMHNIKIPNSLYVLELKRCLLSPQYWVLEAKDNYPKPKGTRMSQDNEFYYMHWGQAKYQKLIPYDPSTNVPILYTAALSRTYHAFATTFEAMEAPQWERVLQFLGHGCTVDEPKLVPEEFVAEENVNYWKNMPASERANAVDRTVKTANLPLPQQQEQSKVTQQGPLTFDLSPPIKEAEDVQLLAANKQAELMQWHYCLGHLTFPKLKQLALNGKIPKKLTKVLPPKCDGCLFSAMTKLPWQGKETKANHKVFIVTKPGECILVNQMTSTEVEFFEQLKGKLTKKHCKCATVFVNYYSRLHFVHLQLDDKSNKTLAAKLAFEEYAAEHGVKVLHYYCDNRCYHDNAFQQACHRARQQLTYCGVNAHFQNGIAKEAIRDPSESARKQLLHERAHWPEAVHFTLWPYALHNAAYLHNNLPVLEDGTSRLELFSSI